MLFSVFVFFFKQKTAYEMRISDWSSDVCSSDLSRRAHAYTSSPTTAVAAPTYPVEVQPKPALIAIPPSHGPSALAALNAELLDAAASVCAPAATAIRCACRIVASAPIVPTANTTTSSAHAACDARGNTSRTTTDRKSTRLKSSP